MSRILLVVIAAGLLGGYGIAEGWWSNRWHDASELQAGVGRLDGVPMTLGNWTGQSLELTDRELAVGQIKGYCYRRYVNPFTGRVISVLLVCGRPGPVAAHTPEVCFAGAGYQEIGVAVRRAVPSESGSVTGDFWTATFQKADGPIPDPLRVSWAWNATGIWDAPASPRWSFPRHPVLFKLYLVQHLSRADDPTAKEADDDFMRLLLPEVQRRLFPVD